MRKLIVLAVVLSGLSGLTAQAQPAPENRENGTPAETVTLTGKITDSSGEPVIGANIMLKGTSVGTISDVDGRFSLTGVERGSVLVISYIGYKDQEVVAERNNLSVVLEEDAALLDEVVVVGYGTMKKKDLTGAISVLDDKQLSRQSTTMVSQQLQGAMPGVQVTRSSSMPGASATIKVRGITTISDSDPLIIVDGISVPSIDDVNSADIEQITVLKDAASAAIYGSRAAAGVILITTKNAKDGDVDISYNGEFSLQQPTSKVKTVGIIDYMNMFNEYKWNDTDNAPGSEYSQYEKDYIDSYLENNRLDPANYPNTDWDELMLNKVAPRHKHTLVMNYGNDKIQSRASLGYEKSKAIYDHYNFEQYRGRVKNHFNFSKMWNADVDFSFTHNLRNTPQTSLVIKHASKAPGIYPAVNPDGSIASGQKGANEYAKLREGGSIQKRSSTVQGKIALDFRPVEGLSISGVVAPLFIYSKTKDFSKKIPYYDANEPGVVQGYISGHESTSLTESRSERIEWSKQLLLNYENSFASKHNVNFMLGYEDFTYNLENLSAGSDQFELNNFPYLDLGNKNYLSNSGDATTYAYRSYFGRLAYNFGNRYYVQANMRADGSSRFHKDNRWGFFPSASLGWVVTGEKFMEDVPTSALSYLKLRGSFGTLGNERIGNYYPYQASVSFSDAVFVDSSGNLVSGMTGAQVDYAVRDISWETTYTWDIGLDATFLDDRLSLTADYYYKKTKDMLLEVKIPSFMGYGNPNQNAGDMTTRGWELRVAWHDQVGDFGYGASFNVSDYTSKMGDLSGTVFLGDQIIREGSEYNEWYGYVSDGLFQTQEEVDNSALLISSNKPGDVKYKDISGPDGVPDGKIDATYDKVLLGSSLPHYMFGGTLDFSYKNFAVSVMFNGVGKQKSRMPIEMVQPFEGKWLSPPAMLKGNYWSVYNTPEQNLAARYPRLSESSLDANYAMSDFWLFNGAYFRLQNVNISYTLPKKLLKPTMLKDVRFYLSGQDLFTIDHYPAGWDPEAAVSTYIARTFTLGVDIKF